MATGGSKRGGIYNIAAPELAGLEIPRREHILVPWLRTKDSAMIHAARGVGKTWVALGLGIAVAAGKSFLGWKAPTSRKVLLVDGEMPGDTLRERMVITTETLGIDPPGKLRIIAADLQKERLPNLATPEGQAAFDKHFAGVELAIFDNVSTLFRGLEENKAESWDPVQCWLLDLRRRGVATCLVHHSGRSGNQRGTSKREDTLDTIISLHRPEGYDPSEGCRFELRFTKSRGMLGPDVAPFEARLQQDDTNGSHVWVTKQPGSLRDRIVELAREGLSHHEIAKRVHRDRSRVSRILKQAKAKTKEEDF